MKLLRYCFCFQVHLGSFINTVFSLSFCLVNDMHKQCRNNLGTSQREAATHRSVKEVIQSPPESLQLFPLIYVVPQPINIECLASFQLLSVLRI